jgi:heterokaryon incompatibility protein (HET)
VVDIHTMSLTHLPQDAPYIALSYVWGEGPRYSTTLNEVENHKKDGGIQKVIEYLPTVIRESIELVRSLKHRYLWVDSLCVVQDSRRSWNLNSRVMDLVYGNSYLTICAADGKSAKDSLKAISLTPRSITQYIEECGSERVPLMVSHLAETFIKRSKWNTRGWTFQERLLSKRCLIFAEGRMFFQCRATAMSEDIVTEQNAKTVENNNIISTASWSIELVQAPLQLLHQLESRAFRVYMTCMELYTDRVLSKSKDILAAFNGMSNLIGKAMGSPLVFGLPSSHFDLSLLWQPKAGTCRRQPSIRNNQSLSKLKKEMIQMDLEMDRLKRDLEKDASNDDLISRLKNDMKDLQQKIQEYEDYGELRFPSWSWCGWMGSGDAKPVPSQLYYNSEMLEGCLANVHQWLKEHTWIEWYIRDKHGHLRSVWSATSQVECQSDSRWKGYGGDDASHGYGRLPRSSLKDRRQDVFERTLPDYPFRVSFAEPEQGSQSESDHIYLQFWTWSAFLRLYPCESTVSEGLGKGLGRYDITDYHGDWCGTIVLDASWGENIDRDPGVEHEFLAISDAKNFTEEENDIWTYYIPKERNQADWDLYYVLLVEHNSRGIASRLGLGKVFKEAFQNSCLPGLEWKEIIME